MKAFLLAAGLGSRLRPLTDTTPKCLLPINGKPLMAIWLEQLAKAGVTDVVVNTHHLVERVEAFAASYSGPIQLRLVYEPVLLGSAGTLLSNREFVEREEFFIAVYADNLTNFDLAGLAARHREGGFDATLGLFRSSRPEACGIVDLDEKGIMVGFEEKPKEPKSDLANAGLYAFSPAVLDLIHPPMPRDIGYDLLPALIGRTRGFATNAYLCDIGTIEAYELAQREWKEP